MKHRIALGLLLAASIVLAIACASPAGDTPAAVDPASPASPGSPAAPTVLPAPTIAAAAYDSSTVVVGWSSVSGATDYNVYRSLSYSGGYSLVRSGLGASTYIWNDTALTPSTTYYYEVAALSGSTEGTLSAPYGVTTLAAVVGLSAPVISSVGSATASSLTVNWGSVSGATGYNVFRDTSSTGTFTTVVATATSGTSFANSGLTANATYWYEVQATNGTTMSAKSSPLSGTTLAAAPSAPYAPTTGQGASTTGVSVSWSSVSGATSYNVYRYTSNYSSSASKLTAVSPTAGTSCTDSTALAGYDYYYFVSAVNAGGESPLSSGTLGYLKMPTPTGLSASTVYTGYVRITWTSISSAYSYYIYQDGVKVGTSGFGTSSYNYYPGNTTTHSYTVTAVGNYGGTSSTERSASESAKPTTVSGKAN